MLAIAFILADLLLPVRPGIEYAPVVLARDGSVIHTFLTKDEQWRFDTKLDEITPELKQAIIYKEDKYFRYHPGINIFAIGRAAVNNIFYLKRTSGASTITMQVARMLQPKKRTYVNKGVEMLRALQLELHYSKDEILQMYLNLVPYGSNVQGVKAASIIYFNKLPNQLSLAEITALSIIPNRPNSLVLGRDNAAIVIQRNKWLKRFESDKLFASATIGDALDEPLNAYRHNAPDVAPQFAWRMRRQQPGVTQIRTTIDPMVQQKAYDLTYGYSQALRLHGIYNASVIVIDNRTMEVKAYIGSSDFGDKAHHGEVDGVKAIRSPGSTLKPLLYGMCMDMGIVTPKTTIADVPINIDGYIPENYDLQFRGNITTEEALKNSLNIPAVKLLHSAGVKSFTAKLTDAGFLSIWTKRNKLGLSMILGGCGVQLDELSALYASFANAGMYRPLRFTIDDSTGAKRQKATKILSPEASYMMTGILRELHRPDLPNLYEQAASVPKIAWKTGTSYGRKDAWSIGYNQRYTMGVWIGNFDGIGVAGLNGAGTATPLLFQLFNAIDRSASVEWKIKTEDLGYRLVCRETGKLPNDYCTSQVMDYYIPGTSSTERCAHQVPVWLSPDEGISYCTSCLPDAGYKTKSYPNIPAELAAWYDQSHTAYEKIPKHNPECGRVFDGRSPIITSLTNKLSYIIVDKESQQLQLKCNTANDVKQVYWYINDNFYASATPAEKKFFIPSTPRVKISCTDDKGRNTDIEIKVKFL
ncbi:MAG: penicillin-binding protein 1C [Sphingobacteriales bacterium]|nr:MAG: penicillin-binding protein 1C [Sphingobacteriales bacterium]